MLTSILKSDTNKTKAFTPIRKAPILTLITPVLTVAIKTKLKINVNKQDRETNKNDLTIINYLLFI